MLIFVIVGFGLLTDYTFSNTNTAEGLFHDKMRDLDPTLPDIDPDPTEDEGSNDQGSDNEDTEEPPIDEEETKEECEEEPGYKYEDGECIKVDDEGNDDDNDHGCTADEIWNEETQLCEDKDDESDDDGKDDESDDDGKDDDSDSDNQGSTIPQLQPQSRILLPKPNSPPTAMNSSVTTTQNNPINIPLKIYDNEGDMIDISVLEAPKFGSLAIMDINTKTLTYTPNSNFIGYDSFIFQGNDRKAYSNNATVSIIIASLPTTPTTPSSTNENSLTFSTNTQNLNNLDHVQLVDLIASEISTANNIDKTKLIQVINDLSEKTKAKGANVIDSLKRMAGVVLNDPTGKVAKSLINTANQQ
jgi:hypothetical protein